MWDDEDDFDKYCLLVTKWKDLFFLSNSSIKRLFSVRNVIISLLMIWYQSPWQLCKHCLTLWSWDKWPPFSRRHFQMHFLEWKCINFHYSVLPKVFWAPVLRTSGSWNLPVRMEGSLVRNFNNYYVLLIHVFDGCSNRFDLCDHFNFVCCCLSPVLISDKRSCWKISQSLKPIWSDVEMLVPLF